MNKSIAVLAFVTAISCLLSCRSRVSLPQSKQPAVASETDRPLADTLSILNSQGEGYIPGDIVRIRVPSGQLSKDDVVLVNWHKLNDNGWGPGYITTRIVGLPGASFPLTELMSFTGFDGKERRLQPISCKILGIYNRADTSPVIGRVFTLPANTYLVETDRDIYIVERSMIGAIVVKKVGHDDEAEKRIRSTVY